MATLVKTGIGDGQTLTPVHITELYDAFTGDKLFDNIIINNTMKVTHDGKVAIGATVLDTPYQLNVQGTVAADIGRFTNLIVTTQSFVTSSTLVVSGSNTFGTVGTDLHIFTGSLRVSGSDTFDNYFLNNVAIGKTENVRNIFEVQGSGTFSNAITASDLTIANSGSFGRVSISGDLNVVGNTTIGGNLTFGNSDTDNISFSAEVDSHFIPDDDSTFNIGSSVKRWNTIFGNTITGSLIGGNNILINNPNITISPSRVSASFTSTGSFGFINAHKNMSVGNDIIVGGDIILDGNLSGSGDMHFEGTASVDYLKILEGDLTATSASIGELKLTRLNLNNQTGSLGHLLRSDGDGNLSFDFADRTSITGKNLTGGSVSAGTPIYITSFVNNDTFGFEKARNNDGSKNPAIGITQDDLVANETGSVVISGIIRSSDLDTSGFSVGDKLYLGVETLVNSEPSEPGVEIQLLGTVLKSAASEGQILLLSGGGGGSTEVLPMNNIFLGSGSLTQNIHISGALDRTSMNNITAIGTGSFGHLIINGNVTASGIIRADAFESVTEGGDIDFQDSLVVSGSITAQGNVSSSLSSTASFGLLELSGIELNTSGVQRDQVLKFNGTNFVPAAPDDTFVFTIADFDMNHTSTPILIGSGSWKTVGALGFTASYNNGPPDGFNGSSEGAPKIQGYVDGAISSSYDMFPLSSSFTLGTNPMAISFPPNSSDDIRFRLFASAGSDTDNEYTDQRIYFFNQFVYGDLSKNNGFNQADIRTLAADNTVTSNDTTRTITVSIGASNYLNFAHRTGDTNVTQVYCGNNPNRLTVAMDRTDATTKTPLRETVSYLNTAGYTENFFVYASKEQNIDAHSTTFVTSTSSQIRNYIYWGTGSSWTNNEASVESLTNKSTTYDDGSITSNTLDVGTFTSKFVILAIPNRYGDNDVNYQLKDNSTNLPFAFDQQSDVTITNAVGFQEDYSVYRSTNQLTMTNATVLIDSV